MRPASTRRRAGRTTFASPWADVGTFLVYGFIGFSVHDHVPARDLVWWFGGSAVLVLARSYVTARTDWSEVHRAPFGRAAILTTVTSLTLAGWVGVFWLAIMPRGDDVSLAVLLVAVTVWWTAATDVLAATPLAFWSFSTGLTGGIFVAGTTSDTGFHDRAWMIFVVGAAIGVTYAERRRALLADLRMADDLQVQAAELELLFGTMGDGMLVTARGRAIRTNKALSQLLRRSSDELAGRSLVEVFGPDAAELEPGAPVPVTVRRPDGSTRTVDVDGRAGGERDLTVWVCRDVTDRVEQEARIRRLVDRDDLTGLASRRALLAAIDDGLAAGAVAVLVIDVDDFKAINDRHGHAVGDAVLVAVADRLRAAAGPGAAVARPGGDEFVIVLTEPDAVVGRLHLADALVADGGAVRAAGTEVTVTLSIGVSAGPIGSDRATLLHAADLAMYQAKRDGRNAWRVADGLPAG